MEQKSLEPLDFKTQSIWVLVNLAGSEGGQEVAFFAPDLARDLAGVPPERFSTYVTAANLRGLGKHDQAVSLLEALTDDVHAQAFLAAHYAASDNPGVFRDRAERLFQANPNNSYVMVALGTIRGETGDIPGAIEINKQILARIGTGAGANRSLASYFAHYNLANDYYKQQESQKVPDFSKVYEHLETALNIVKREIKHPSIYLSFRQTIDKDMRAGYFAKMKDDERFKDFLKEVRGLK